MKNNSLLTYVLYALLGIFILAAGYYACQKQKEKDALAASEQAELQQTLENMGYAESDTLNNGSSFANTDTLKKPTASRPVTSTGTDQTTGNKPVVKPTAVKPTSIAPVATTTGTAIKPKTTTKGPASVKGPGTGRWAVRAGTFAYVEGARRRLEEVIRAGYPNAEISKTSDGKAAVVVFRSNSKEAAIRVADQLEVKGIDAAVFDRK